VPERGLLLASRPHPAEDLRRRDHPAAGTPRHSPVLAPWTPHQRTCCPRRTLSRASPVISRMAAWPRPGRCPANIRRPWPGAARPAGAGTAHPRGPAARKPGSREAGSIPAPGLIQDDGQRTWKLASLLILERRRTTHHDKPASKPHEDQIEQTQRHGRSLCPTAKPHLSRQVTAIGRLLAPHRRIAAFPACTLYISAGQRLLR
jgi:hypothetical protein